MRGNLAAASDRFRLATALENGERIGDQAMGSASGSGRALLAHCDHAERRHRSSSGSFSAYAPRCFRKRWKTDPHLANGRSSGGRFAGPAFISARARSKFDDRVDLVVTKPRRLVGSTRVIRGKPAPPGLGDDPRRRGAFALITLLGFDYRPQLADLPDAKLWWRIAIGADYGPLNAAARGKIDLARIERQRPDILRVVASIHTGAVPAIVSRDCAGNRLFPARSSESG
jgi:hypothetical protein